MPTRPERGAALPPNTAADLSGGREETLPRRLTERQLQILALVARGKTNRQVGEALGISERTVRNHMRTILRKLSSGDRTHAVVLAIGAGLIPIPIEPEQHEQAESTAVRLGRESGRP